MDMLCYGIIPPTVTDAGIREGYGILRMNHRGSPLVTNMEHPYGVVGTLLATYFWYWLYFGRYRNEQT